MAAGGELLQSVIDNGVNIGGSAYNADPTLNGSVDEFRVYNQVLSQQYIAASFNASADAVAPVVAVNRNITVANSTVSGNSGGAIDLAGFELDIGGNMSGPGTLTLLNGGTVVLTGNSSANLNLTSNVLMLVGTGGNLGALTGGNVANSGRIIFNRTDSAGIWGANIADGAGGAGTISLVGSGTTSVISSNNTYSNTLLISAGKLNIGNNGTIGSLSPAPISLLGVLGYNRSDNGLVVSSPISGGGTVTQVGSGITSVTGNNSYTGGSIFAIGELEVDSLGAIGSTGVLSFTGGALRYSATNTTDYQARFSTAANQLYAFDTNGQVITFTQPLTSTGISALTKLGAGTLVLTTTNAYVTTNVKGGVLQVNNSAGLGSGDINFSGPGVLAINKTGANTISNNITGAGGTFSQLVGVSILTGTNTWTGGLAIASGAAVQIGSGGSAGSIGGAGVANNGLLAINRTGLLSITGPVNNSGTITHTAAGTTTLTGAYSGTGLINISAGRFGFGTTAGTRQTPAVLVETNGLTNTATLDMANRDLMIHSGSSAAYEAHDTNTYDFGLWTLPGSTRSTAAAASGATSLGIMSGADYNNFSPNTGTFDGKPVANSDTLIKYTYAGDINLDGLVNDDDLFPVPGRVPGPSDRQLWRHWAT